MSIFVVIVLSCTVIGLLSWFVLSLLVRLKSQREARRLGRALSVCHSTFSALDRIPEHFIARELRRGLVLMLTEHLKALAGVNPYHLHLSNLQRRVITLNKLPSRLKPETMQSKVSRKQALLALEELAGILANAVSEKIIDHKAGALAKAAAVFASQQLAIELARQSAKDAENVRAYPQALSFAYQAKGLCRKLPPLMGKSLLDMVSKDIARLETQAGALSRT